MESCKNYEAAVSMTLLPLSFITALITHILTDSQKVKQLISPHAHISEKRDKCQHLVDSAAAADPERMCADRHNGHLTVFKT